MKNERVAHCGQKALGSIVTLHVHDGHSHFGGVETCGSVWACPVCAAKITEGRKEDIQIVLDGHRKAGGRAYMATLTIPHYRFQDAKTLRKAVSTAFRKVKAGRRWQEARNRYHWAGDVRALEVTHGGNGWHPHLHVLVLFDAPASQEDAHAFGEWLFDAWRGAVERMGFGRCSYDAFTFEEVTEDGGAADYVGKWGAALELTKAHTKVSRAGGRTPWQILADYDASGSERDANLFREYALAFKGARQLTWSRGLRERYAAEPEKSDEQIAQEPMSAGTHAVSLSRELFDQIVRRKATADVLEGIESDGLDGVIEALSSFGIGWRLASAPSLEAGRHVPLLEFSGTPETSRKPIPRDSLGVPGEAPVTFPAIGACELQRSILQAEKDN